MHVKRNVLKYEVYTVIIYVHINLLAYPPVQRATETEEFQFMKG
jgi:hypothetical protein